MTNFKEQKFFSNSLIYIVGVFLNQGVNFLTLFILIRLLSPDNYALITLYGIFVNACLSFVSLQSSSSINNALIEYGEEKLNSYTFSISLLSILVSCVTILFVLLFNRVLENIVGFPTFIMIMIVIQAALSSFATLQLEKNRVRKKAFAAVFWNSAIPVFRLCLSVFLIVFIFNFSYLGDIYGFFIAAVIIGLIAFAKTMYGARLKFKLNYIKFCLPITIPIIFHVVSNLILTATDKVMLDLMLGRHEMGIYAFIFNVALIPTGIWFAVNNAWSVEYFEKLNNNDKTSLRALTNSYIKYIFCAYVFVLLVLPEFILIIAPLEYHSGIAYSSFVVAGGFFTFLYTICSIHQIYRKKTKYIPVATIVAALVNIALNFLFIPLFGAFGAALSIIISYCVLFLMHYTFSGIVIGGFPIKFLNMAVPATLVVCVAVIVYMLLDHTWVRLILAVIVGALSAVSFIKFVRKN